MKVTDSVDNSGWNKRFLRLSPDRRKKTLDRAVRLINNPEANPNERAMAIHQLQAALEIDPSLIFEVLASVQGSGISNYEAEELRQEAARAQSKFNVLVDAIYSLRESLTEMGVIEAKADLPATVEEWNAAIGNVVARETRHLAPQKDHLREQKRELEKMRAETLAEIEAARQKAALSGRFSTRAADAKKAISELSFDYEHIRAPEPGEWVRDQGIFTTLLAPTYTNGEPLGIECEFYSAPEDLRYAPGVSGPLTQPDSVREIARLRKWHGYDGGDFADEAAYMAFIAEKVKEYDEKNRVAPGEWFRPKGIDVWALPPGVIVDGKIIDGNGDRVKALGQKVAEQNHFDLRNRSAFAGKFVTQYDGSGRCPHWYWSSTRFCVRQEYFWSVAFHTGIDDISHERNSRLSARPVRVGRVRRFKAVVRP